MKIRISHVALPIFRYHTVHQPLEDCAQKTLQLEEKIRANKKRSISFSSVALLKTLTQRSFLLKSGK
ncbi:hypothetical protein NSE_0662 [Neorickettsia sennetsu str. Miyayama]|uniref:Uncharacterized protein n=1 Tax=Ehrlichia sennetsu (strain ATCC VR-367 / Miyayama) TaxID=222891 RepID=Q2GDA6_EHRS3|nr:hypothetical protein NSE_0662 [Neorickettsia sennetsu str. Miyayama]